MPGGDRTGPWGLGSRTGRAAGFCSGYAVPGYANPGYRAGFMSWGRGWCGGFGGGGGGRGWRNRFYATGLTGWQRAAAGSPGWGGVMPYPYPAPGAPLAGDQELDELKNQAEYFEKALKEIHKQIEELQSRSNQD